MAHDVIKSLNLLSTYMSARFQFFLCVNDSSMEVNNLGTPIGIASGFCF